MMWQEARKQEKKIRGMLVDYKRRAERRKDYYEKIKAEPTQFIQIHGRPCKIHLDPAVALAGDSPANMMSWQGNHDILIDRFDVRAHLDYIPDKKSSKDEEEEEELTQDDRSINYERYRILAQNDFLGVTEEKFLHQLNIEEQFGPVEKTEPQPIEGKKKVVGAAIGYNYNEAGITSAAAGEPAKEEKNSTDEENEDEEDEDEDSDIDFDLCVDVNKISSAQAHEMNASALAYGMVSNDFFSFLTKDVEEAENLKIAREREEEKAMFSGRKSRRERRAFREKKLIGRKLSPPSYAASKAAPIADLIRQVAKSCSRSRSRSPSPPNAGMIQYITSFGGDETPLEPPPPQIIKTSVHTSKEDDSVYKRTVRYKSTRSPESTKRREKSPVSVERPERSVRYRSHSRERKLSPDYSRRTKSRSHSPPWRRSPTRTVRYQSASRTPERPYKSRSPLASTHNDRVRSHNDRFVSYRRRQSTSGSRSKSPPTRTVKKSSSPQPMRSIEVPAPPVITRYYGRHKKDSSSSDLDLSDADTKSDQTSDKYSAPDKITEAVGNSGGRSKAAASAAKVSLQERLKKKRQALINRQYKADKRAERLRLEKAEQERQDREDEMREISIKMRRRERQKRHQYYELDGSNAAENSDEDRLSNMTSGSASDKADSDSDQRSRSSKKNKDLDLDLSRRSRENDKKRDSRKDSDIKRDSERSVDRDRKSRKSRDEERPRIRERSRERVRSRDRSRERDKYRRDTDRSRDRSRDHSRDRSRDRVRDRSRDRERYSRHRSREREYSDSSGVSIKKLIRPLVDY